MFTGSVQFCSDGCPGSAGAKVQSPEADNAKYVPILVIAPPSS